MSAFDEPLSEIAPLARALAETMCGGCGWYHGFWPELRRLRLAGSLATLADFFATALAQIAIARPRILIAGAADQAILARTLVAAGHAQIDPEIAVLDRCPTPLALNRDYAERAGIPIATIHSDLLMHRGVYDAIVCHGFIGEFAPARRLALFAKFHELLAPGGSLIAINRIRDCDPEVPVRFSAAETEALLAAVEKRSNDRETVERARIFFQRMQAWPIAEQTLAAHISDAGFARAIETVVESASTENRGLDGVAIASRAGHACVVGRKR